MARPVKWSRDLYAIRERADRSQVETWSRTEIQDLFDVGRATAQSLMKAIGEVQNVGGAHFVDRASLLSFLNDMIAAPTVEEALRQRTQSAEAPPARKPLKVSLPSELRAVMIRDLPPNISLSVGRLVIESATAVGIMENLVLLAQAMQNDLQNFESLVEPPVLRSPTMDDDLRQLFASLRQKKDSN